jgi:(1->4)-alpha-D-glucan 1-alpha-D-glucosylmutase
MLRAELPWIERACAICPPDTLALHVADLLSDWHDGRIKMFLTACGLRLRSREGELILHGGYVPLTADDLGSSHVIGFARCLENRTLLAIVPRLTANLRPSGQTLPVGAAVWGRTRIALPHGCEGRVFRNAFTGEKVTPVVQPDAVSIMAADVFRTCPVALLWSDSEKPAAGEVR